MKPALALAALLLCSAAEPAPLLLREQAWTAPGETLAHDLTHAPGECVAERSTEIEIGRALFRSPMLLGGPAARAGLSCHACHSNGGVNARFLLPELSDRPGHADVTAEWASAVRGDGVFNPIAIPTLTDLSGHETFGQRRVASLEDFVRGVIEEEFQGPPPPEQAFISLIAYLRALRVDACPASDEAITLSTATGDVRRAIAAAERADAATARLLLVSAQDAMGRIVERLPERRFRRERRDLELLSRWLGDMRQAQDVHAAMRAALFDWNEWFDPLIARIARREERTYFNQATLSRALQQP